MAKLPECISTNSIGGTHEFDTDSYNCVCGCGFIESKCLLCSETKQDLLTQHIVPT